MKVVAFVPIKLNSQRLKDKNILLLNKKPLCHYIFKTLLQVKHIDEIHCYCSDEKILDYIPQHSRIIFSKRSSTLDCNMTKGEEIYNAFTSLINANIYIYWHTRLLLFWNLLQYKMLLRKF